MTSGVLPERRGNAHPNIVPYDTYATADGHVILAVGNDAQFRRCCSVLSLEALPDDPRFVTNPARLRNRDALNAQLVPAVRRLTTVEVIAGLEAVGVPVGPVQTLDQVFASDQVAARNMQVDMEVDPGPVRLIDNPLRLSRTPVTYRHAPPGFGADTHAVLNRNDPFGDWSPVPPQALGGFSPRQCSATRKNRRQGKDLPMAWPATGNNPRSPAHGFSPMRERRR